MQERRKTIQLDAMIKAFEQAKRPLSVEELHTAASKEVPSLGLRTVYRVIRKLEESNEIAAVVVPGHPDRYELAAVAATHHHHFHCTSCDRVYDVPGCPGRLNALVPDGFVLSHHEIMLSGLCQQCA
jgi:Fur family ferric uptake transcriptional regulator